MAEQQQQQQQPQGTEYTLQGVMRFLQVEWHNHERIRNAWDIEKAELKAKIAKQEGDFRNSKRLNVALDKQVRMLENALKAERAKNRAAQDQPPPYNTDSSKLPNGTAGESEDRVKKPHPSSAKYFNLDQIAEEEAKKLTPEEKELQREKNKKFLQKCVEELTYILTPPKDPPGLSSIKQQETDTELEKQPQPTAEQMYEQQQIFKRNQQTGASHLPSMPNHHPPPVRQPPEYVNAAPPRQQPQSQAMTRQPSQPPPDYPPPLPDHIAEMRQMQEQQAPQRQRPQQDFDLYGRQVTTRAEEIDPSQPLFPEDDNGWNFDDSALPMEPPLQAGPPPRRTDVNLFPSTHEPPPKSPTRTGSLSHTRRRSSGSRGSQGPVRRPSDGSHEIRDLSAQKGEPREFKVKFALRGHLDVIRSIIFTGGGSPSEPEICTASDDGTLKRWIIPSNYSSYTNGTQHPSQSQSAPDLDIQSYFTHRGHEGIVTSLAACPASPSFSTGGRAPADGWVFSGGQDATVKIWERGRVDPKATLDGHTDAIWALCVLPAPASSILGPDASSLLNSSAPAENRILLASGSADCTIKIWAVTAPPQLSTPQAASAAGPRRGVGGSRRHSITSGSNFPSSPQPSTASQTPLHSTLVHSISVPDASGIPTCITPLGPAGESFVASYTDAAVLIFDSRTGEQIVGMASAETYDGSAATGVNSVVITSAMVDDVGNMKDEGSFEKTGSGDDGGKEGVIITGHEDRFVRFFDANSGQCTYSMLAHPASIASISLSPDGHELVSAGHDAALRFWSLEKRSCIQEVTSHRLFRAEGVVSVVWSSDGKWVVSGGGDGVVKVFGR